MYNSTIVKGVAACDFNGLAYLTCGREEPWKRVPWYSKIKNPIRAVNIGGLFVLEQWILPGFVEWGESTGVWDQYTYSAKCAKMGNCQKLKVRAFVRGVCGFDHGSWGWALPGTFGYATDLAFLPPLSSSNGTPNREQDHWKHWYTPADFKQMKEFGLNTIRLPVGYWCVA